MGKNKKQEKTLTEPTWKDFVKRAENFHWDSARFIKQAEKDEDFFKVLHELCDTITRYLSKKAEENHKENFSDKTQELRDAFSFIYNFIAEQSQDFTFFSDYAPKFASIYNEVFEACFFASVCTFIHETKRIDGTSLRKYLYDYSPLEYGVRGSANYFNYDHKKKDAPIAASLLNEEIKFRKTRHRLLSERPVYNKRSEWSAMSADSEHEWFFYSVLEKVDGDLADVYKRFGNLYNDVNAVLKLSPKDEDYESRKETAYKKFTSKLKKINFERFLQLQGTILSHIVKNEKYIGMNIYRFERRLRLFNITNEVKILLKCNDDKEEKHFLTKFVDLKDIEFPKLYQKFYSLDAVSTIRYVNIFQCFKNLIAFSSHLIFDYLIEKGVFGDDWENLFLDTINGMAESVFYAPDDIDYTIQPRSQECFEKLLLESVKVILKIEK